MITFTQLKTLYKSLTTNSNTANDTLGGTLISNQHRLLLQRYFDNERTYTTLTIGAQDLTVTGIPALAAVSATLSTAWPSITTQQLVSFDNGEQRTVIFTQNSTTVTWQSPLTSACTTTTISTIGVQAYPIPANVSKIKNDTITIGQLVYTPAPIQSIQEWTQLNAIPYTSDIPAYFYIYNNQVNFWPIPSSSGNVITFNYKSRVPDLNISDYTTGTLSSIAVGDNQITGVGTTWSSIAPTGVDITFLNLYLCITPPSGDGIWYPIQRFESNTSVTLLTPVQNAPSTTATAYIIGQLPLLHEDFHDMLAFYAAKIYYSTVNKDNKKYVQLEAEYAMRDTMLQDYAGTKSVNVDLGSQPVPANPNLFIYAPNN